MNVGENAKFLREAARVAYGSGFCEKTNGGRGNIGILKDPYGRERIVKFNTHGNEEGGAVTNEMRDVSNSLRKRLWEAAKGVVGNDAEALEKIRKLLNVDNGGNSTATSLLTRNIVAKVITKIGGQGLWDAALAEKSIKSYSSTGLDTTFRAVYDAQAKVGNDARRSRANWELDNAMKAVTAALPRKQGGDLTLFSGKIQEGLKSLVTDDVRRRLADTEGGGEAIGKACQAFVRQNALRLASMYVTPDIEGKFEVRFGYRNAADVGTERRDGKNFLKDYLALGPNADAVKKLRDLGYLQNSQFLRSVHDEFGPSSLSFLLRTISERTAGEWNDAEPIRLPSEEYEHYVGVNLPLDERDEEDRRNDRVDRDDYIECQTTPGLHRILSESGLLKAGEGRGFALTLDRKGMRILAQEADANQARLDEIRSDLVQANQEHLEDVQEVRQNGEHSEDVQEDEQNGDWLFGDLQDGDSGDRQNEDDFSGNSAIRLNETFILNENQVQNIENRHGMRRMPKTDSDVHYSEPFAQERGNRPDIPKRSGSFVLHKVPDEIQDVGVRFQEHKRRKEELEEQKEFALEVRQQMKANDLNRSVVQKGMDRPDIPMRSGSFVQHDDLGEIQDVGDRLQAKKARKLKEREKKELEEVTGQFVRNFAAGKFNVEPQKPEDVAEGKFYSNAMQGSDDLQKQNENSNKVNPFDDNPYSNAKEDVNPFAQENENPVVQEDDKQVSDRKDTETDNLSFKRHDDVLFETENDNPNPNVENDNPYSNVENDNQNPDGGSNEVNDGGSGVSGGDDDPFGGNDDPFGE